MPLKYTVLAVACAVSVAAMAGTPAAAQRADSQRVNVSHADLDLDTQAGAETLLARLREATLLVCGDTGRRMTMQEQRAVHECSERSLERAVAALGNANVSARFAALGGVTPAAYATR